MKENIIAHVWLLVWILIPPKTERLERKNSNRRTNDVIVEAKNVRQSDGVAAYVLKNEQRTKTDSDVIVKAHSQKKCTTTESATYIPRNRRKTSDPLIIQITFINSNYKSTMALKKKCSEAMPDLVLKSALPLVL